MRSGQCEGTTLIVLTPDTLAVVEDISRVPVSLQVQSNVISKNV